MGVMGLLKMRGHRCPVSSDPLELIVCAVIVIGTQRNLRLQSLNHAFHPRSLELYRIVAISHHSLDAPWWMKRPKEGSKCASRCTTAKTIKCLRFPLEEKQKCKIRPSGTPNNYFQADNLGAMA